jgi:two-component system sensor histidine kinase BaeS
MTSSLRTRLTLSYMLVASLCVLMVSVLVNGVLESSFRRYLRDGQARKAQAVVAQIGLQIGADGVWDQAGLTAVGTAALEQGMIVKLSAPDGATVWDATVHNSGLCVQMIAHMAQNMASRYANWRGGYTEKMFPVRTSFREVGTVAIGFYGPFFMDDGELAFINSLNRLLVWVGLAALAMAGGLGLVMARRITSPLQRVALATQMIATGHRGVVIAKRTRVRELDGIASAVNDLSRALREQEALRHRLTTDMAHELRTPLAALQSHLEALIDGVWEPAPARLAGTGKSSASTAWSRTSKTWPGTRATRSCSRKRRSISLRFRWTSWQTMSLNPAPTGSSFPIPPIVRRRWSQPIATSSARP